MLSSFRLKSASSVNFTDEASQTALPTDTDTTQQADTAQPKITLSFTGLKSLSISSQQTEVELGEITGFNRLPEDEHNLTAAQAELMKQEELLGTEIAAESGPLVVKASSKVDKLIQDQLKKHSSPQLSPARSLSSAGSGLGGVTPIGGGQARQQGIRLKIKGDTVVESDTAVEEKFSVVIKKRGESSSSSVVVKQGAQQMSIPKLKISASLFAKEMDLMPIMVEADEVCFVTFFYSNIVY